MLKIKDKIIESPLILAPIAGFSDSSFRKICISKGCGLTVTELISAEGIVRDNPKTVEMLKFTEAERPLGIQIFGSKPDVMGQAAKIAEGYNPDFIDINLGCPAKKVVHAGSGSALSKSPALIYEIAYAMVSACKIPVTAKIRTGWDEDHKNYMDVVKALEDAGIAMIAVHGRTRAQMYSGNADWKIIEEIKNKSSLPIIGNGDIDSHEMALERMKQSGVDGVMIGRAAMGNPWIFSGEVPNADEIRKMIEKHIDLMLEQHGDFGIMLMRKHIVSYIHGFKNAAKVRHQAMRSTDKKEIMEILQGLGERQK